MTEMGEYRKRNGRMTKAARGGSKCHEQLSEGKGGACCLFLGEQGEQQRVDGVYGGNISLVTKRRLL